MAQTISAERQVETVLRETLDWAYLLARKGVFDLEQGGVVLPRTPYQERLLRKLAEAEEALNDYRSLMLRDDVDRT